MSAQSDHKHKDILTNAMSPEDQPGLVVEFAPAARLTYLKRLVVHLA